MSPLINKIAHWLSQGQENTPLPQAILPWISALNIVSQVTWRTGHTIEVRPYAVRSFRNDIYRVSVSEVAPQIQRNFYALKVEQIIEVWGLFGWNFSDREKTLANILIQSKWGHTMVIDSGLPTTEYSMYSLTKNPEYIPRGMLCIKDDDIAIVRKDTLFGVPQRVYPLVK